MKELKVLGTEFIVLQFDDKLLLQQLEQHNKSTLSAPVIGQTIVDKKLTHLENIVASETEILLYCKQKNQIGLLENLSAISRPIKSKEEETREIDVCFELGLDWSRVCDVLGQKQEAIIKRILKKDYSLINYGFQPGFMYLDGLTKDLQVPRLDKPRLQVPKGSIAIGGKYLGIYGSESPGGWNIIGRSSHTFEIDEDLTQLPRIGQTIKVNRLNKDEYLRKHKK